ncbi:cell division protein FtsQ/DivIB [Roseicyclus mahoneyensis]|uniref:Cell division protein FtsQ n=1 Tax=Roseicyclus mahoneyensis TaxID=164332 RepID=A0A316GZE0_9RHOB|nr:cell division protein FtsQ/DivIB [Roseicyclus mahoneyensis]PWK60509.1 cell division protein FtsQ [Roseicyclus mahoneyensis]
MRPLTASRSGPRLSTPALMAQRGPLSAPAPTAQPVALSEPSRDPAPSIWSYRVQRLWLTPLFRKLLRVGLPTFVIAFCGLAYFGDEGRRAAIWDAGMEIRREIENRPEFRVNVIGVEGASDPVIAEIRAALALDLPMSSFDLDLTDLRARVEALPAVAAAELRIQTGGYLAVRITERVPALIWQTRDDIVLIDAEGHFVAALADRQLEAPLPAVAGEGADGVVDEALALYAAAAPLGEALRGFVRVGERRWDVVLNDGRRILLPADRPVQALDRALALDDVTDILARDVLRIDLRNPDRLTVQLTDPALEELRRLRALERDTQTGERSG